MILVMKALILEMMMAVPMIMVMMIKKSAIRMTTTIQVIPLQSW